jgi:hypothetical protein
LYADAVVKVKDERVFMIWAMLKAGQKLFKLVERLYCTLIISASARVGFAVV